MDSNPGVGARHFQIMKNDYGKTGSSNATTGSQTERGGKNVFSAPPDRGVKLAFWRENPTATRPE